MIYINLNLNLYFTFNEFNSATVNSHSLDLFIINSATSK